MNPHHLRTFLAVVSEGSISSAARAVFVSQSTASSHIRALEEAAGIRLLHRTPGGVRPTAAGRRMAAYASQLVGLERQLLEQLRTLEGDEAAPLRLATTHEAAHCVLPRALARVRAERPELRIEVLLEPPATALVRVRDGACELALLGGQRTDASLRQIPILQDDLVLVAVPPIAVLPEVPLIGPLPHGLAPRGGGTVLTLGDPATRRACALAGIGAAFLPRCSVAAELQDGQLQVLPWPGTPRPWTLTVVHLPDARPSPAATLLIDGLHREFRRGGTGK